MYYICYIYFGKWGIKFKYKIKNKDISVNEITLLGESCDGLKQLQNKVANITLYTLGALFLIISLDYILERDIPSAIYTLIFSSIFLLIIRFIFKLSIKNSLRTCKNMILNSTQSIEVKNDTYYFIRNQNSFKLTPETVKEIIIGKKASLIWIKKTTIIIPNDLFGTI